MIPRSTAIWLRQREVTTTVSARQKIEEANKAIDSDEECQSLIVRLML